MLNPKEQFAEVVRRSESIIKGLFPIEGRKNSVVASNWRWERLGDDVFNNIQKHKKAKLRDQSIMANLVADIEIRDKDGNVLDKKKATVFQLPHATNRASFIVDGKEMQVINQFRLRPGLYVRPTSDNNIEAFINTSAAGTYRVILDRVKQRLQFRVGVSAHYPLVNVLKALGISEAESRNFMGSKLFEASRDLDHGKVLFKLFKKLRPHAKTPASVEEAEELIRSFMQSKPLDPEVTKITVGSEYESITGPAVLEAAKKVIKLSKAEVKPDDTESIAFKSIHSIEDFIPERLQKAAKTIQWNIAGRVDRTPKVSAVINPDVFSDPAKSFFTMSEFSRYTDQSNPLEMHSTNTLTTTMGEGGIGSTHSVSDSVRNVHPSHVGVLDGVASPEGSKVGITNHLAASTKKVGNKVHVRVIDAKTGEERSLSAQELDTKVIAFPDQYDLKTKPPKARFDEVKGRKQATLGKFSKKDVDYIYADVQDLFGLTSNSVPFIDNNDGLRVGMANRHMEQTVNLVEPDAPKVQAEVRNGVGFDQDFGKKISIKAPDDGVVTAVTDDYIKIKIKGRRAPLPVYIHNKYPLNSNGFLHDTPIVKVGDKVKKGQVIAKNNFTRDGSFALGKDLKTAFMPWKGYNFEDGIVISEGAAKKMTSWHKYDLRLDKEKNMKIGVKDLLAHYPDQAETLIRRSDYDEQGIIKKGARLEHGQLVIPAVQEQQMHEDYDYARLHRALSKRWVDKSIYWKYDHVGRVVDVVKSGSSIRVVVETKEPMRVGDKLSGRVGQKGIVVKIIPDNEMLQDKEGKPFDVLFSSLGVIGRVNPGQLYEAAASKIAKKTGKPFIVKGFDPKTESVLQKMKKELKKHGLDEFGEEEIKDPTTGITYKNIMTGDVHFLKLRHMIDKKFSARGVGGTYSVEEAPTKNSGESAQRIGGMEMYSLLAGGAEKVLDDMYTIKGQKNDEYWRALQLGLPLPEPKQPFVAEKFLNYMAAAGINLKRSGDTLNAMPLTDKEILEWSNGEVKNPTVIKASDLSPEKGGLFDPAATGGIGGEKWAHYSLAEPIVHPLMEKAVSSILGLKTKEFAALSAGALGVDKNGNLVENTGDKGLAVAGEAFKRMLSNVDVDKELAAVKTDIKLTRSIAKRDTLNKKRRFLQALKKTGLSPAEAYINEKIPILPAKYRAVYPLPDGSLNVADPVHAYREVILMSNTLKDLKQMGVDDDNLVTVRADLVNAYRGLVGTGNPITRDGHFKGLLKQIKGNSNKTGYFQSRVMKRPQDLSARATIIPDPKLDMDEFGLPEKMGLVIYKPFIVKRLVGLGYSPLEAREMVEDGHPMAKKALGVEVKERPAIINRAPSLHKFSMVGVKPRIVKGKAIRINPLIVGGLNADHDGDAQFNLIGMVLSPCAVSTVLRTMCSETSLEDRKMATRIDTPIHALLDEGESLYVFDIDSLPKGQKIKTTKGAHGDVHHYHALDGMSVIAYDEEEQRLVKAPVSQVSLHDDVEMEIVNLSSGRQIMTDDDPRAVYGVAPGDLTPSRYTPAQAAELGVLVPRAMNTADVMDESMTEIPIRRDYSDRANKFKRNPKAGRGLGWFFGMMIGDGWGAGNQIRLCTKYSGPLRRMDSIINAMLEHPIEYSSRKTQGNWGDSYTHVWSATAITDFLTDHIGKGAENKHLPWFWHKTPMDFRIGLVCGLLDSDGGVGVNSSRKKPQLLVNYSTTSFTLAQQVGALLRSLGIASSTKAHPPRAAGRKPSWTINISTVDAKRVLPENGLANKDKRDKFVNTHVSMTGASVRGDIVPFPAYVGKVMRKIVGVSNSSLYATIHASTKKGCITRAKAKEIIGFMDADLTDTFREWIEIVNNTNISWDQVVGFEKTGVRKRGYDLTVPGYETFMDHNGVILSNTMGVHVPVTEAAKEEIKEKLLPSKNLFSPANGRLMHMPSMEGYHGLYLMTKPVGKPKPAESEAEILAAYRKSKLQTPINTAFKVGDKVITPGVALINTVLPDDLKISGVFPKKEVIRVVTTIAKRDPQKAVEVTNKLKDWGWHYVSEVGYSFSLRDLEIDHKKRDAIIERAKKREKTVGFNQASSEAVKAISDLVHSDKENRLVDITTASGALGGKTNSVDRMVGTPVGVTDHEGKPIPVFIPKSYAEGHDIGSYWSTLPGARKGMIAKGLSTADTGYLSKLLVNANIKVRVSELDCKTLDGVWMQADDPDISGRVVARGPMRNQLLDEAHLRQLKKASKNQRVLVRSPLKCESKDGICQKCLGANERGELYPVGFHIGVLSAQTIGEPSTQAKLREFHVGGAIGGGTTSGFTRISSVLKLPDSLKNKAVISDSYGMVTKIEKADIGGWNVYVNNEEHYVPEELGLGVTRGQSVKPGDRLSRGGDVKPQEYLKYTGDIDATRELMISELDRSFKGTGVHINRKVFETVLKPMTDKGRVTDPGDGINQGIHMNDVLSINKIRALNKTLLRKIEYEPVVMGITQVPHHGSDFIGRMMHERIMDTARDSVALGLNAKFGPKGHPITDLAFKGIKKFGPGNK